MSPFPLPVVSKSVSPENKWYVETADGEVIAYDLEEAHAAFIVTACNSHEALVASLTELLEALGEKERFVPDSVRGRAASKRWLKAWGGARAALSLASGGKKSGSQE